MKKKRDKPSSRGGGLPKTQRNWAAGRGFRMNVVSPKRVPFWGETQGAGGDWPGKVPPGKEVGPKLLNNRGPW